MATSSLGTLQVDLDALVVQFMRKLDAGADRVEKFGAKVSKHATATGAALSAGVTAPLLAAAAASVAAADQLQKADRMIAAATGASGKNLADLRKELRDIGKESDESFETIAGAIGVYNTALGASGKELSELVAVSLDASDLLGEDIAGNATKAAKTFKQFGLDATQSRDAMALMFGMAQQNVTSLGGIIENTQTYGAVLANANFSMIESADLFAKLEGAGIGVSRVMPGVNALFRKLADGGIPLREGLLGVADAIAGASDEAEGLKIATEFFGAEGAARLTRAIRSGAIDFRNLGKSVATTADGVARMAEENETLGERFDKLKNKAAIALEPVGELLIDLFDAAMPVIEAVADGVGDLGERFDNLSPSVQAGIVLAAGIVAAVGPVLLVGGKTIEMSGKLAKSLVTTTGTAVRLGIALSGPALVGLAALSAAMLGFEGGRFLYDEFLSVQQVSAETIAALQIGWEDFKLVIASVGAFMEKTFEKSSQIVLDSSSTGSGWLADLTAKVEKVTGKTDAGNMVRALSTATKAIADANAIINDPAAQFAAALREAESRNADARAEIEGELKITLDEIETERKRRDESDDPRGGAEGMAGRFVDKLQTDTAAAIEAMSSAAEAAMSKFDGLISKTADAETGLEGVGDAAEGAGDDATDAAAATAAAMQAMAEAAAISIEELRARMKKAKEDAKAEGDDLKSDLDELKGDMIDAIDGFSRDASSSLADMVLSGKGSFEELKDAWAKTIAQMVFQRLIFDQFFGGLSDILRGGGASVGGGLTDPNLYGPPTPTFHGGVRSFAHGGSTRGTITRHAAAFRQAAGSMAVTSEGDREELGFLPLTRIGADFGVKASVSTNTGTSVVVNDFRSSGRPIEVNRTRQADGSEQIDILVADSFERLVARGRFDRVLGNNYRGLRRTGRRG